MDQEQLRAVIVGDRSPDGATVVIDDYDPRWPDWFEHDRAVIAAALGDHALAIDHVGSTSVPGLPAKPIIDILLQVPDSADEAAYVPPLERAGYLLRAREPHWLEHRVLKQTVENGAPHAINLHVFSPGPARVEITRMLGFRDWLRTHDDDRDRYADTKRALATRKWRYVQDYAEAKTDIIEEILGRALT